MALFVTPDSLQNLVTESSASTRHRGALSLDHDPPLGSMIDTWHLHLSCFILVRHAQQVFLDLRVTRIVVRVLRIAARGSKVSRHTTERCNVP